MLFDSKPYASLTPDTILDSVESVGFHCDGRLSALNSYENRVYEVGIEDELPVIVKFYRPNRWSDDQILEEHQFALELSNREVPVIAPCQIGQESLHYHRSFRFALYPKQGGRIPDLERRDVREWIGRYIGRIHSIGSQNKFKSRIQINPENFGLRPRNFLIENNFLPVDLEESYRSISKNALDLVNRSFEEQKNNLNIIRLHGDAHPGNILWRLEGPHFVDLDDACLGPAVQDLWMLTSGDPADVALQIRDLIAGYEVFREFDQREVAFIETLRTLRLMNYAGWLGMRWEDPAFPIAFPWFNTQSYWTDHIVQLQEQTVRMMAPPINHL